MDEFIVTSVEDIVPTIRKYGVAIMENILTQEECKSMYDKAWDCFEELYPTARRNKPETWRNLYDLKPRRGLMFQNWGVGHSQHAWDVRCNDNLINAYRAILTQVHGKDCSGVDIKASFDGVTFGPPPEVTNDFWHYLDWFHTNQQFGVEGLKSVQCWVTGEDVGEHDATFSFLKGSHLRHVDVQDIDNGRKDFYIFSKYDLYRYFNECDRVDVVCKAGSAVFWDSRTVCCMRSPIAGREQPRFCNGVFVSYMPEFVLTKHKAARRKKLFNDMRCTDNWLQKSNMYEKYRTKIAKQYRHFQLKTHPIIPEKYQYLI